MKHLDPEVVHSIDQLGAELAVRCARDGLDAASVRWAALQQLGMALALVVGDPDHPDPDDHPTEAELGALGYAAWWALVVGVGLDDPDLVEAAKAARFAPASDS